MTNPTKAIADAAREAVRVYPSLDSGVAIHELREVLAAYDAAQATEQVPPTDIGVAIDAYRDACHRHTYAAILGEDDDAPSASLAAHDAKMALLKLMRARPNQATDIALLQAAKAMATDDVLDRLEKLLAEATPGPWECGGFGGIRMDGTRDLYTVMHGPLRVCAPPLGPGNGREQRRDDMQAVAALRNAAPALIRLARAAIETQDLNLTTSPHLQDVRERGLLEAIKALGEVRL